MRARHLTTALMALALALTLGAGADFSIQSASAG